MQLDKLQKTLIRKITLVSCYTFCYCSIYTLRRKNFWCSSGAICKL